jgi:hypothetical protein
MPSVSDIQSYINNIILITEKPFLKTKTNEFLIHLLGKSDFSCIKSAFYKNEKFTTILCSGEQSQYKFITEHYNKLGDIFLLIARKWNIHSRTMCGLTESFKSLRLTILQEKRIETMDEELYIVILQKSIWFNPVYVPT